TVPLRQPPPGRATGPPGVVGGPVASNWSDLRIRDRFPALVESVLGVAESLFRLALELIGMALGLGRAVARPPADLFLQLALDLIQLAFDLVVDCHRRLLSFSRRVLPMPKGGAENVGPKTWGRKVGPKGGRKRTGPW